MAVLPSTDTEMSRPHPDVAAETMSSPTGRPRERDVITAFAEITGEAIGDADLEQLLRSVCVKLCRVTGVSRSSLYLKKPGGRFRGAAGHCSDEGDITEAVKRQESGVAGDRFSREVIETGRPVLINDVANDPRPHRRTMEHWRVRAMLGVPLVFDGEVIGLLFVDNKDREHVYTQEDIEIAEMFAQLSASSSARRCSTSACAVRRRKLPAAATRLRTWPTCIANSPMPFSKAPISVAS